MYTVLVESKNVFTSLHWITVTTNLNIELMYQVRFVNNDTYSKETGSKQLPLWQNSENLSLGLAGRNVLDFSPTSLHHIDPLWRLDISGRQSWLWQQKFSFLELVLVFTKIFLKNSDILYLKCRHMVHVSCLVKERSNLGHLVDNILVNLFTWHHQQQSLEIIWSNLVEHNFNIQFVVQPERMMPDWSAEDEIVDGSLSLEVCGHIQDILLLVQRSGEGLTFYDAVQTELFSLMNSCHSNNFTKVLNNIIHNSGRLGVDNSLCTSR